MKFVVVAAAVAALVVPSPVYTGKVCKNVKSTSGTVKVCVAKSR